MFFTYIFTVCGSSSVVELLVANEKVAGSNPVSRSNLYFGPKAGSCILAA